MASDDRRLQLVRAWPLLFGGARQHLAGLVDRLPVPQGPVLVLQQHQMTVAIEAGRGAGAVQPDQRKQASHFRLRGHQLVEQRGQPLGVFDEVARLRPLAQSTGSPR